MNNKLHGLGYGGEGQSLNPVETKSPTAKDNRISYERDGLTEWYVNGLTGIEQGFTLEKPPAKNGQEMLTLSIRLPGSLPVSAKIDGSALVFANSSIGLSRSNRC